MSDNNNSINTENKKVYGDVMRELSGRSVNKEQEFQGKMNELLTHGKNKQTYGNVMQELLKTNKS